tara:strand:+ start:1192 stop:1725 length:534 start_codon:yes stop_codon:yes gene_type:complete
MAMGSNEAYEMEVLVREFEETVSSLGKGVSPISSHIQQFSQTPTDGKRIEHEHIELLGHTTNVLVFSLFDSNHGKKFSREDVRLAIDSHKKSLKDYLTPRDISRIQSGKAAVDYWIDRLVENDEIHKQNSNPVLFWRIPSKSKAKLKQPTQFFSNERVLPSTMTHPKSLIWMMMERD